MSRPPDHLVSEQFRSRATQEQVQGRFFVLNNIFLRLKRKMLGLQGDYDEIEKAPGIYMNHALLYSSVYSYWYDIFRHRDFHHSSGDGRVNKPKKAAYTVKWIMATRPISFDDRSFTDPVQCHRLMRVNELFAFRAGLAYAEIPLKLIEYKSPDGDLTDKFTYNLCFRSGDVGLLSLWFETVMTMNGLPLE